LTCPTYLMHRPSFLHDALPISVDEYGEGDLGELVTEQREHLAQPQRAEFGDGDHLAVGRLPFGHAPVSPGQPGRLRCRHRTPLRSEEHTSELQSRENIVCRLLL